ncbi:MAG: hypothetical protein J0I40_15045 [Cellulomonas sp.]|uniref:hypothetical protein n=1 Tax=Cellulomonas sp. 73-92 TaxID=1895740 RepID=UPI000B0340B7|nr:hypothetical protein [Cellulomonas sp. 73-92]MBN9376672.1 hypothetical protein [Cellulomonas sp.]
MSDGARLVGFGAVLALALAIGLGIGAAVGPLGSGDGAHQQSTTNSAPAAGTEVTR